MTQTTSGIYGLYTYSHWQGAGLGGQIAHGTKAACTVAAHAISSCSFGCYGHPLGNHQVGTCARVQLTRRPRGITLPADLPTWTEADIRDLLLRED